MKHNFCFDKIKILSENLSKTVFNPDNFQKLIVNYDF